MVHIRNNRSLQVAVKTTLIQHRYFQTTEQSVLNIKSIIMGQKEDILLSIIQGPAAAAWAGQNRGWELDSTLDGT